MTITARSDIDPRREPDRGIGRVSVVVCTYRRPDRLGRCLASLRALADPDVEVVVVDNARRPVVGADAAASCGARLVHEPRRGLDVARNRGVEEATADIVAFVDDDCEVSTGWLTELRGAFVDPTVAFATGRVVPAGVSLPSQHWFETWFSFDRGPTPDRFAAGDRRPWYPLYPWQLGTGCNMAFRRSALEAVGGFDVALDMGTPVGGGGDIDVFARLLDAGFEGVYVPTAVVRHHHRETMHALRWQFFGYGATLGALCCKAVLSRDGHRREALGFFRWRLREHRTRLRARLRRTYEFPISLIAVEAAGQLVGPLAYLWSTSTRPRRATTAAGARTRARR